MNTQIYTHMNTQILSDKVSIMSTTLENHGNPRKNINLEKCFFPGVCFFVDLTWKPLVQKNPYPGKPRKKKILTFSPIMMDNLSHLS